VGAVRGCADAGESHACAQLQHALSDEARDVPLDVAHKKTADGPQQRVQPLVRLPLRYTVRCQLVAQGAARRTTHRYTRPFICTARGGGDACMGQPARGCPRLSQLRPAQELTWHEVGGGQEFCLAQHGSMQQCRRTTYNSTVRKSLSPD